MDKERISNFFNGLFKSESGSAAMRVLTLPNPLIAERPRSPQVETVTDLLDTIAEKGTNRELTTRLLSCLSEEPKIDLTSPEGRQSAAVVLQGKIAEYTAKYNQEAQEDIRNNVRDHLASLGNLHKHPTFRRIGALVKAINFIEGQDPDLLTKKGLF